AAVHTGATSAFNASRAADRSSNPGAGAMLALFTSEESQLAPPLSKQRLARNSHPPSAAPSLSHAGSPSVHSVTRPLPGAAEPPICSLALQLVRADAAGTGAKAISIIRASGVTFSLTFISPSLLVCWFPTARGAWQAP